MRHFHATASPPPVHVEVRKRRRVVVALFPLTVAIASHLALAASLSSQVLRGQVIDARTEAPISAATIVVRTQEDSLVSQVMSGSDGQFVLGGLPDQTLFLEVSAFGYTGFHEQGLQTHGQPAYLVIQLDPAPVATEGLRVSVEAQNAFLRSNGYYERRKKGHGRFISPEEIQRVTALRSSDYFQRMAGVSVTRGEPRVARGPTSFSRRCRPAVYQDGLKLRDALSTAEFDNVVVAPELIEAIEVYSGAATAPSAWRADAACGLIVVWTRR